MIPFAILLQVAPVPAVPAIPSLPAQPPATMVVEPVGMAIAGFDADIDGTTSAAELAAGVRRSFESIDTPRAGSIGYIGFADWAERWLGDRNALPSPFEIDADGDNRITLAELQAQFARVVARLDRNKDGAVSRAELLTIRATVPRERPPEKPKRKGR
jgi:hypothetical protein